MYPGGPIWCSLAWSCSSQANLVGHFSLTTLQTICMPFRHACSKQFQCLSVYISSLLSIERTNMKLSKHFIMDFFKVCVLWCCVKNGLIRVVLCDQKWDSKAMRESANTQVNMRVREPIYEPWSLSQIYMGSNQSTEKTSLSLHTYTYDSYDLCYQSVNDLY